MKRITLIIILSTFSYFCLAQPQGITAEMIKENKISNIEAKLDLENDDPNYENLKVESYEFDSSGRCTRKKNIYPFYDVVTTSKETTTRYLKSGIVKETLIHRTEEITPHDKEYIGLFGETNDTTIIIKIYIREGDLMSKSEYTPNKDTIATYYEYENSRLKSSLHTSSGSSNELHPHNFIKEYHYDDSNRLKEEHTIYKSISMPTITVYEYYRDTRKLKEKITTYEVNWLNVFRNGSQNWEFETDSTFGQKKTLKYDSESHLIKETTYLDLTDTTHKFHWIEYKYEDGLMTGQKSFSNTEELIKLTDEIRYEYDEKGLLTKEVYIYGRNKAYSKIYSYQ